MVTKPVPNDLCIGVPISHLLTMGSMSVLHSVLNVKAVVFAFNQEKVTAGAFSVITNLRMDLFQALLCKCTDNARVSGLVTLGRMVGGECSAPAAAIKSPR